MRGKSLDDFGCDMRCHDCDRRGDDAGPPKGWCERRKMTERRMPVVLENVVTEAEWFQLFVAHRHKRES